MSTTYVHILKKSLPPDLSPCPPPPHTTRTFLPHPHGKLELLSSLPPSPTAKPPLLFLHGGFGNAHDYIHYLPYFSALGYPSYALSLLGHGASHNPGYWSIYFTTLSHYLSHFSAAIQHVRKTHDADPVVIGHSSGGGLTQALLSRRLERVAGAVLIAPMPGYGGYYVNKRWWWMDWGFYPRMMKDGGHPRSPLSTTALVRRAFFCDACPEDVVVKCEKEMAEWESMAWVMGMMTIFALPEDVVDHLNGTRGLKVIAATNDRLMGTKLMEELVEWYRDASGGEEVVDGELGVVEGAGHHIMRDIQWEEGARMIREWLEKTEKR